MNAISPVSRDGGRKLRPGVMAFFCLMNKVVALKRTASEKVQYFKSKKASYVVYGGHSSLKYSGLFRC